MGGSSRLEYHWHQGFVSVSKLRITYTKSIGGYTVSASTKIDDSDTTADEIKETYDWLLDMVESEACKFEPADHE